MIALYFSLNAIYSNNINSGNVASEYTTYATISAILLFIQTLLVGNSLWNIFGSTDESANKKTNKLLMIVILFIINLYLYGISSVILKYFSTDG
jgi:hypothetical protein